MLAGDAAMDLELLVKIEGEARRAVRALNLKTAAKRGPTFAEVVARIAAEEAAGRPGILHQWHSSLPSKPSKPSKPGFEGFEGADPCPFLGSAAAMGIQLSPRQDRNQHSAVARPCRSYSWSKCRKAAELTTAAEAVARPRARRRRGDGP